MSKASGGAELVHLHRVIDHQVGRHQRIGAAGIGAHRGERIAHRGQIHHRRDAGEILQQHARRHEADFFALGAGLGPGRDIFDVGGRNPAAVFVAQQIFQQNLDRKWQPRRLGRRPFPLAPPDGNIHSRRSPRAASPPRQNCFVH